MCVFWTFVVKPFRYNQRFLLKSSLFFLISGDTEINTLVFILLLSLMFYFIQRRVTFYYKKSNLFLYPIFLVFLSLIIIASSNLTSSSIIFNATIFGSIFIIIVFFSYQLLYSWRTLPMSLLSFTRFFVNMLHLSLYILTFYLLFKTHVPIYLSNLSVLSHYRYLIFSLISIIFLTIFVVGFLFRINMNRFIYRITYPHFKEEMRLIMHTWNNNFFGAYCSKLIDLLADKSYTRFCYFFLNFFICYFLRIIALFVFVNFTFFHGDLRNIFYVSPLLFVAWIFSFFDYYFITFLEQHSNYLRLLVNVKTKNAPIEHSLGVIQTNSDNLSFTLTPYAIEHYFTMEDLPMLSTEWLKAARITTGFIWYRRMVKFFNITLLRMNFVCWYFITYIFFISKTSVGIIFSGFWGTLFKSGSTPTQKFFSRSYAIEAYKIRPAGRKPLEEATSGGYKALHLAMADKDQRNPSDLGQPTHGKGTPEHKTYPLHPTTDFEGKTRPQNYVPPKKKRNIFLKLG